MNFQDHFYFILFQLILMLDLILKLLKTSTGQGSKSTVRNNEQEWDGIVG